MIKKHNLNPNLKGLQQSATLAINDRRRQLQKEGKDIYNLGLGQSPFPVPKPVVNALKHYAAEKDYLHVKGLPQLREAVAKFHRLKDHVNINHENIIIGPGSKELLFILQLVYDGSTIIPSPGWVSYSPQAKIIGKEVNFIQTTFKEQWRLSPEKLEDFCKKNQNRNHLLILNYPGNPNGVTYDSTELQELANVAKKHNITILSDEIYGQLHHRNEHISIAQFYPKGTIISSGLSKWCGAGGWRLGTFAFPENMNWLLDAMAAVASETFTSVSAPIQYAAIRAFKGKNYGIEDYLSHSRKILSKLGNHSAEILSHAGVDIHPPTGGFYLFPDFKPFRKILANRGITNGPTLCERLLQETGVISLPGASFEQSPKTLTARLAYIDFDGAEALTASQHTPLKEELPSDFTEKYCGKVITAMNKIVKWLNK